MDGRYKRETEGREDRGKKGGKEGRKDVNTSVARVILNTFCDVTSQAQQEV